MSTNKITAGQVYRHYKGGLYRILAVGLHSDTEEKTVIYQNIDTETVYKDVDNPDKVWARAYVIFDGTLEHEGKTVKRFDRVA